ncbi:MAG TPA: hypothetical protein ENG40_02185 [Thermoprotei archaeon]|nr:hypothetical protein [Thermoprotei archaeon]
MKRIGRRIAWNESLEKISRAPTEFLDMYYLSEKPGDIVIMDRSTARDFEERLKFLEKELTRIKKINDFLKVVIITLSIALIIALLKIFGE